jgi:hypothetical protein
MNTEKQIDDLHEALASTESELRDEREALTRVEAERDSARLSVDLWKEQYQSVVDCGNEIMAERDAAQAHLAEAVGLLRSAEHQLVSFHREHESQWCGYLDDALGVIKHIIGSHAQTEQQEAHGAQAEPTNFGQELEAFEKWRHTQADSLRRCGYPDAADKFIQLGSVQWAGWQARAALATQPAACEPVAPKEVAEVTVTLRDGMKSFAFNEYSEAYNLPEGLHHLYTSAPPAAAHGDDRVSGLRWVIARCAVMQKQGFERVLLKAFKRDLEVALDAMRAQAGEGGEV